MRYYDYSPSQLEEKANELICKMDIVRLTSPKKMDVYDVVDYIGCTPDWKYITPKKKVMGMTAFNDGSMYFWPASYYEAGMIPEKTFVEKGTIVIDQSILDDSNIGKENFTVMHECFHWLLHRKCFVRRTDGFSSMCGNKAFRSFSEKKKGMTALEINEYQANFCAAVFLMPRKAVIDVFSQYYGDKIQENSYLHLNNDIDSVIATTAKEFNVNYSAMKYRLQSLRIITREQRSEANYIIN